MRLNATVFNDARVAADGLKDGQQQIVNLERSAPDMAERIVDLLSGVTYALDGSVDRIGDKVYLFAPANVQLLGIPHLHTGTTVRRDIPTRDSKFHTSIRSESVPPRQ